MYKRITSLFSINSFSISLSLTLFIILIFLLAPSFLEVVELKTLDLRFKSRGTLEASDVIALAVIDEKSLDAEGRWPWPRSKIARLIDYLSDDGAKVIGFDVGFLEPDENNNLSFIRQLESKIDSLELQHQELDKFLNEAKALADNDRILADAIKRSKAKVILGYFLHMTQKSLGYAINSKTIDDRRAQISGSKYPIVEFSQKQGSTELLFEAYAPEVNLPIINQAAASSGYFNVFPDLDGVVRWVPLIIKSGEEFF